MTFLSASHSTLSTSGCEYLAYIFHMQLADGSSPEREHADKFSSVSSRPGPLVSLDATYEVNYTLSGLIWAPRVQMFASHLLIRQEACSPQEEHVRSPGMLATAIVILAAIYYNMSECCPFTEIDTGPGTL